MKAHDHNPDFHARIRIVHGTAAEAFLKAHLAMMHNVIGGSLVRLNREQTEALHRTKHPEIFEDAPGPTPADHAAGITALNQTATAETLRKLSQRIYQEVTHASLGHQAHEVEVCDLEEVQEWLVGWAIRIENGEDA